MPPADGSRGTPDGPFDRPALRRCVAVEPAVFAAAHWGRAPLLSRSADLRAGSGFAGLLSLDDVDELLGVRGLRSPFLRIAQDGAVVPVARFTGSGGAGAEIADQVLDDRVLALYARGATLVLQGLHRLWPPLVGFTGELATELGAPVQANAYLTPAGNRGFATHYDTHDVFVLQVAGRKRWLIHEPVLPDPLERQPWGGHADEVAASASGPPALDAVLSPGDALYLPRGWLHSAQALGEQSLHLTLGLKLPTRHTLVEALLARAVDEPALRTGFPLGVDLTDPAVLEPLLGSTVDSLRAWLEKVPVEDVAAVLRTRLWPGTRPAPIRPVAQATTASTVDAGTVVVLRRGLRWRLDPVDEGRMKLTLTDRTVELPGFCAPALERMLGGQPVRVGDLPGLDDDADRVTLARHLLREAVVTPAT